MLIFFLLNENFLTRLRVSLQENEMNEKKTESSVGPLKLESVVVRHAVRVNTAVHTPYIVGCVRVRSGHDCSRRSERFKAK